MLRRRRGATRGAAHSAGESGRVVLKTKRLQPPRTKGETETPPYIHRTTSQHDRLIPLRNSGITSPLGRLGTHGLPETLLPD